MRVIPKPTPPIYAVREFDVKEIRADFPVLSQSVHGNPLVYLDNAATSQKPSRVIDRLTKFYEEENANIHRGVHYLSAQATTQYDRARARIASALNAAEPREVIFVRGTTEGINLVASSFLKDRLRGGDEIVLTVMEHHANIIPWQMIAQETGAILKPVPMTDEGALDVNAFASMLGERTRIAALIHVSNVLGTVNPMGELIRLAHERGVPVLVDGAQAVPHGPVDVRALDADFYVFSGHKVYGPDGIGVLYGKAPLLETMKPYQGGGDMIETVRFEGSTFKGIPERFEAGTPHISGAIGLAEAFDYLEDLGWEAVQRQEKALLDHASETLRSLPGVRLFGDTPGKASVVSFTVEGIHPHDIGTFLDADGIAIRVGHHCAQPLMQRLGVPATARASFAFYNTHEEIEQLGASIRNVQRFFA